MRHETFFDIMYQAATTSAWGAILAGVVVVALLALVAVFVGSFCAFAMNQGRNLKRLYTERETLDVAELHPYTRSILENRCPEMAELSAIAASLKAQESPAKRAAARGILRNIEATLELYEENVGIRNQVLSSLSGVRF